MVGNDAYDEWVEDGGRGAVVYDECEDDGARGAVVYSDEDELPCEAVMNWSLDPEEDGGGDDEPEDGGEEEYEGEEYDVVRVVTSDRSDDGQTSYPVWFVEYVPGVNPLPVPVPLPLPFPLLSDGSSASVLFSLSSDDSDVVRVYPDDVVRALDPNPNPGRRRTSRARESADGGRVCVVPEGELLPAINPDVEL